MLSRGKGVKAERWYSHPEESARTEHPNSQRVLIHKQPSRLKTCLLSGRESSTHPAKRASA